MRAQVQRVVAAVFEGWNLPMLVDMAFAVAAVVLVEQLVAGAWGDRHADRPTAVGGQQRRYLGAPLFQLVQALADLLRTLRREAQGLQHTALHVGAESLGTIIGVDPVDHQPGFSRQALQLCIAHQRASRLATSDAAPSQPCR